MSLSEIGFGLAAGFVGWMAAEFVGKPFRRGLDLVADARTATILYANVSARAKEFRNDETKLELMTIDEKDEIRLCEAELRFRSIGAELGAFAQTEPLATMLLRLLGRDLEEAGTAFIGLSNSIGIFGHRRAEATSRVKQALSLRS